ncbi:MAG: hypothetical protein GX605_00860 [Chloroflexi bacterium]|nr:hypothetical protein [Chloroflexota bacterium]
MELKRTAVFVAVVLALLLLVCGQALLADTPAPTTPSEPSSGMVRILLFYSSTCPHCRDIIENYLPELDAKYPGKLEVAALNLQDPSAYELMLYIEEQAKVPEERRGYVPTMVVGHYIFVGSDIIRQNLEGVIDDYLAKGGVDYPVPREALSFPTASPADGTPAAAATASPAPATAPTASATPSPLALAYFYEVGCGECDRVSNDLNYLKSKYPQLEAEVFDVNEQAALNEWLSQWYGVPPARRLTTPVVFVGDDYLIGEQVTLQALETVIQRYADRGAAAVWKDWDPQKQAEASSQIVERFRSMGVVTVILAALVDGLNPCAFATLILFISYLAISGRKGREILIVGLAFALGFFVTYLLVGVGLLKFLAALPFLKEIGRWIYLVTAVICLALAGLSFYDYLKARREQTGEMTLSLPLGLRRRINRIIRQNVGRGALALTSLGAGFAISLIELACTGQVYLPTILFVLGVPELKARAVFYLVLYNLIFILPLVVVFVLAYLGTTSEKLQVFVSRQTKTIKLATALLFLLLAAGLLLYTA